MSQSENPPTERRLIFIAEDDPSSRKYLVAWLRQTPGYEIYQFEDGEQLVGALDTLPDIILLDIMMPKLDGIATLEEIRRRYPDLPVIMLSAQDSIDVAVSTLKKGATDYIPKPFDPARLKVAISHAFQVHDLSREISRLRNRVEETIHFKEIISSSDVMSEVFRLITKVRDADISVLIQGESGTGKELIARTLHFTSKRASQPFVVVNCASIPKDLLESELFGHERGAFTGAIQRKIGKFEQAHGGSIFLDEIGELDISMQAKLLRVLQNKEVQRVGGTETHAVDVRVISATNRDLGSAAADKSFREDLYYRLASFPIHIPPLRSRRADVLLLIEHFLQQFAARYSKEPLSIERAALTRLYSYDWPGNVRELEHAVERAVLLADSGQITLRELPLVIQTLGESAEIAAGESPRVKTGDDILPFEKLKEEAIRHALVKSEGNINEAAKKLQLGRATLYRLIQKYKISV